MHGMTIVQANNQLLAAKRRRITLENDAETLRQCRTQIRIIKMTMESRTSTFRQASRREQADWCGESGTKYSEKRNQVTTNTSLYLNEIDRIVDLINQQITNINNQITTVNGTIRNLRQFIENERVRVM